MHLLSAWLCSKCFKLCNPFNKQWKNPSYQNLTMCFQWYIQEPPLNSVIPGVHIHEIISLLLRFLMTLSCRQQKFCEPPSSSGSSMYPGIHLDNDTPCTICYGLPNSPKFPTFQKYAEILKTTFWLTLNTSVASQSNKGRFCRWKTVGSPREYKTNERFFRLWKLEI